MYLTLCLLQLLSMTRYFTQLPVDILGLIRCLCETATLCSLGSCKTLIFQVFCCHGGIPPPWVCPLITAIDKVPVPLMRPAEQSSIAWELLWNDPIKYVPVAFVSSFEDTDDF